MKVIILDTETTGLPLPSSANLEEQPQIIEFAAIKCSTNTGRVLGEISQLIDPGVPIPEEITKITGITDKHVKGKPTFAEFLPDLAKFFKNADMMVAHNLPFDKSMMEFELRRLGIEDFPWPPKEQCSVELFEHLLGYRPKLKDLFEHYTGNPLNQTHRALDDVQALMTCIERSGTFDSI